MKTIRKHMDISCQETEQIDRNRCAVPDGNLARSQTYRSSGAERNSGKLGTHAVGREI
jgi:hypothetical protein